MIIAMMLLKILVSFPFQQTLRILVINPATIVVKTDIFQEIVQRKAVNPATIVVKTDISQEIVLNQEVEEMVQGEHATIVERRVTFLVIVPTVVPIEEEVVVEEVVEEEVEEVVGEEVEEVLTVIEEVLTVIDQKDVSIVEKRVTCLVIVLKEEVVVTEVVLGEEVVLGHQEEEDHPLSLVPVKHLMIRKSHLLLIPLSSLMEFCNQDKNSRKRDVNVY